MEYFKIKLYSVCTFKYGELLAEYIKENQNHLLDDSYTVLRSSQISPEELLLTFNSMSKTHKPKDTQRCLYFTSSHANHCKQNIPFCLAWRICTIAENNAEKLKNLENLKTNLSKYHYPDSLIKHGFQKALSIPQKDVRKPKKQSNKNILPFTTTFNRNNPDIYGTIKSLVNCLKNNNVSGFHNIKLIKSKCQSPNLKKLSTKAEFGNVLSGTFNCSDKRGECCNCLLINDH